MRLRLREREGRGRARSSQMRVFLEDIQRLSSFDIDLFSAARCAQANTPGCEEVWNEST